MIDQERSKRKPSGGLYRKSHKKKLRWKGNEPTFTHLGEKKLRIDRVMGGNFKLRLLKTNKINVFDPSSGKCQVAEIIEVIENPANRHFSRRNIITKGAILQTSIGKVRVTNRPGQEGNLNGVLLK